jgi:hypothetical protein
MMAGSYRHERVEGLTCDLSPAVDFESAVDDNRVRPSSSAQLILGSAWNSHGVPHSDLILRADRSRGSTLGVSTRPTSTIRQVG